MTLDAEAQIRVLTTALGTMHEKLAFEKAKNFLLRKALTEIALSHAVFPERDIAEEALNAERMVTP